MLKELLMIVGILGSVRPIYLSNYDSSEEQDEKMLEYLEDIAGATIQREMKGPEYNVNLPVNEEGDSSEIIPSEEECEFDFNDCDNNDNCFLGHQTNEFGCIISCECKKEGLFEGDIRVDADDVKAVKSIYGLIPPDRAASKYLRRWDNLPTSTGTFNVPYKFTPSITDNKAAVSAIQAAMEEYAKQTCIRFIPHSGERDYLEFFRGRGCYSYIGRNRGRQVVSIGRGCERKGTVMHELMHAMGFWHEQSRPDRDSFVSILAENIKPGFMANFRKISARLVDSMGSPYDAESIMHYHGYSFSKNRKPTIVLKGTMNPTKGQRYNFSEQDRIQLNTMYKCKPT